MAALTDDIEIVEKTGLKVAHPVVASDIIYRGALVMLNAAGNLAPAAASAGAKFAGVAYEQKDNSSGAAGDVSAQVIKSGLHLLTGAGLALTDVGSLVYASDDQTVTTTYAADLPLVGVIEEFVSATQVYVRLVVDKGVGLAAIVDLGAFTDPPSAGEMATLRTAINSVLAAMRGEEMIQG